MRTAYIMQEIRATRDIQRFVRIDSGETFTLLKGEIATLPEKQAKAIISKNYATFGKCAKTQPCVFAQNGICDGCVCDLSIFPRSYPWCRADHDLFEYVE